MKLVIPGVPISVNHCYFTDARGRRLLTATAEQYRDTVGWAAKVAWLEEGQPELAGSLVLEFSYYLPDRRRLDLDNTKKLICDGIAKALGLDDRNFLCRDMERSVDKANPRVEIEISDVV